jgi:hypothetical protein
MAIEGLHNIIGIRPVNKEQDSGRDKKKRKKKSNKKEEDRDSEHQNDRKGHIDIRI